MLAALSLLLTFCDIAGKRLCAYRLDSLAREYGVEVRRVTGEGFFPPEWLEAPISATASDMAERELDRMADLLRGALRAYPRAIIVRHLRSIHLCGSLRFYGLSFGATNTGDRIYLCSAGVSEGYTDEYIVRAFHHEFAHILYSKYDFPVEEWNACNPPGFVYAGGETGGVDAIRRGRDSLAGSERLYSMGFLAEYAMASSEEDFCVYSEMALGAGREFGALAEKHDAVKRKYAVWRRYYLRIDPGFTRTAPFRILP